MRPTLPQKFHLKYHLVIGGGRLWTPLLATPTAPEALHGSGQVRKAFGRTSAKMRWSGADLGWKKCGVDRQRLFIRLFMSSR